jgi:hypothetical protein
VLRFFYGGRSLLRRLDCRLANGELIQNLLIEEFAFDLEVGEQEPKFLPFMLAKKFIVPILKTQTVSRADAENEFLCGLRRTGKAQIGTKVGAAFAEAQGEGVLEFIEGLGAERVGIRRHCKAPEFTK